MNGQDLIKYRMKPQGWNWIDVLLEPYTYLFNTVVMSANGETPVYYDRWHQTDVIRAKAIDRLEKLTSESEPWFLTIAPTAPHVQGAPNGGVPPVPLKRHSQLFTDLKAPKPENFNPRDDAIQKQKPTYLKGLKALSDEEIDKADNHYRARIQSLQGLDEIVEDVVGFLDKKGQLENTYVIYTSDNGYHIGTHRLLAGKCLPYIEDSNIPLIVRGPSIPEGVISAIASTHIDFAPTFLDIAEVEESSHPTLFDGRSLLREWSDPGLAPKGVDREILNVEFWGDQGNEITGGTYLNNSYKTLRFVGTKQAWLYSKWCNGDVELYDTKADQYELQNLAINPKAEHVKLMNRLNGLLLITKSCQGETCRNPWQVFEFASGIVAPTSLAEALDGKYDDFFADLPVVTFKECINIQSVPNELPFYPQEAKDQLGREFRNPTDNYAKGTTGDCTSKKIENSGQFGGEEQRHSKLADIDETARELTKEELPKDNCEIILPSI